MLTAGLAASRPFLGVVSLFDSQICLLFCVRHIERYVGGVDGWTDRDRQTVKQRRTSCQLYFNGFYSPVITFPHPPLTTSLCSYATPFNWWFSGVAVTCKISICFLVSWGSWKRDDLTDVHRGTSSVCMRECRTVCACVIDFVCLLLQLELKTVWVLSGYRGNGCNPADGMRKVWGCIAAWFFISASPWLSSSMLMHTHTQTHKTHTYKSVPFLSFITV